MRDIIEALVCPQHGLLRPENIALLMIYGNSALTQVKMAVIQLIKGNR